MISLVGNVQNRQIHGAREQISVHSSWGWGGALEMTAKERGVSVCGDESVVDSDRGDGHTTLRRH